MLGSTRFRLVWVTCLLQPDELDSASDPGGEEFGKQTPHKRRNRVRSREFERPNADGARLDDREGATQPIADSLDSRAHDRSPLQRG